MSIVNGTMTYRSINCHHRDGSGGCRGACSKGKPRWSGKVRTDFETGVQSIALDVRALSAARSRCKPEAVGETELVGRGRPCAREAAGAADIENKASGAHACHAHRADEGLRALAESGVPADGHKRCFVKYVHYWVLLWRARAGGQAENISADRVDMDLSEGAPEGGHRLIERRCGGELGVYSADGGTLAGPTLGQGPSACRLLTKLEIYFTSGGVAL